MSITRITQGPLTTAGTNPYDQQSVVLDVVNNIMETSGNSHVLAACQTALAVIGPQTALTTITTAQNLISKVLGAGALNKLNRTLLIEGTLIYTSPGTTTPTISIAVTLGGVTLCTITTAGVSSTLSTNMPIQFAFLLNTSAVGSAGTIESHGTVSANITANTPAAAVASYSDTNTAASSAVNLTTALTLLVTIAASSTITSAQLRLASINVVF
jgi:hypothetical protein